MSYQYNTERKDATEITRKMNQKILQERSRENLQIELEDVENAKKHLILQLGEESIVDENGEVIYDAEKYPLAKTREEFPDTVNPYLWQIKKDNDFAGVLKMAEGYYVAYGIEIASVGFIRSDNGWIVLDCGNFVESATVARKLVEKAIGEKIEGRVKAVIYSHSHLDHYAGVEAFMTKEQAGPAGEGKIPVIAPSDYEISLVDDNLYAGVAMARRLQYQGGMILQRDEKGTVSAGLNSSLGIRGRMSMILPTMQIEEEKKLTIDGVELTFIPSPNTETRAHMCVYSHKHKVLYLGDNSMGTIHNTYTMRGARVRDAGFWGGLFYHLYLEFGEEVEVVFQGHGIPHFKMESRPDNLKKNLLDQAVAYKYPSDQALLLANKGVKLNEVGNTLKIPDAIQRTWYTRAHYGNYSFNARGAVQRYLGFYDGNPVNLLPLPERKLAEKIVEYAGSAEEVLERAEKDFEKGEYQWVATITNHLVYLDPQNKKARYLCADALEQLGYQCETGLWRNAYLCGAKELRHPEETANRQIRYMDNRDVMPFVSASLILDYLAINFDGEKAIDVEAEYVLGILREEGDQAEEYHRLQLYKGTILHARIQKDEIQKDAKIAYLTNLQLYDLANGSLTVDEGFGKETKELTALLQKYVVNMDKYRNFNIIEPLAES